MSTDKKIKDEKRITVRNTVVAVLVIAFFVGIILMYYSMLYSEKRSNIIKSGEMTAKESADHIERYLSTNIDSVKLAAYTLDGMLQEQRSDEELQDYLVGQSTAVRSAVIENSTGLYAYIHGRFFSGTNWEPPEGYDATQRPWYTKPMENPGEITILDPYVDVQSGNVMLALGKTLCDGVSVVSVDVSLDRIQTLTEDAVKSGNSDMELILNDKGLVVAHSDRNEIGKNYKEEEGTFGAEIVRGLNQARNHYFDFVFQGASYVIYVADMQNNWYCISVKDATQVFGSLNSILFITIVAVVATVLVLGIIMTHSNRYLHMSAKAIAANEAKSAFLSRMSHEIRTPINAILGMNEMIIRECGDPSILTYSENIKTAGRSLLGLVNDILDFSRIEAGKVEIIPVDYDLADVINDLVNMIHNRAEDKGLLLTVDFDKETPRLLNGDEIRIKQIISNLLTNAVKYTEKGGVTFRIGFERFENDPDNILLIVSVKDTGIGIREEDMPKLFSQFERIEENRNRHIEGTGLGISISENLLEMMGSKLLVESVYGKGSTFGFSVKQKVISWEILGDYEVSYRERFVKMKKYRRRFTAEKARILVVDDNPMNLTVFKSLIKQTCVKIDSAESGEKGISLAEKNQYDLIFLDHMMPGKDGIETLREIRKNKDNPSATAPAICLTANAIAGARETYLAVGFDDYLSKPIDPDRLENMMITYLPGELVELQKEEEVTGDNDEPDAASEQFSVLADSGIDVKAGLKNSGTKESYLKLLKMFYDSVDEKAQELSLLSEEEDLTGYTIRIHALKSSARIIGAAGFGEKAQRLEKAGKAGDRVLVREENDAFLKEYRMLGEAISVLFEDQTGETEKPEAEESRLKNVLEEIRLAAEDMDSDGLEKLFAGLDDYHIPQTYAELFGQLRNASENYEYDVVLLLLAQK